MFPSLHSPGHDPRWDLSGRTAFLATMILNLGLGLGLLLIYTASQAPSVSSPLYLEFKALPIVEPLPPMYTEPPVPKPEQAEVVPEPPPVEVPIKSEPKPLPKPKEPLKKTPVKPKVKPALPVKPPSQANVQTEQPLVAQPPTSTVPVASSPSTTDSAAQVAAVPVQTTDMALILSSLTQLIERHKDYPKAARRAGYEGIVVIKVILDQGGVITGWTMEQGSTYPVLDKAAEKTFACLVGQKIHNSNLQAGLSIVVPVRYELRDQS
ncbi:MAG: TonB family protein [Desulfomicrobium sp.]|nr:TonB family protein [Desulfomicrobium sp.]